MPVHDWSRVSAGNFHHFHQRWIASLSDALNGGSLPDEFEARIEPVTGKYSPDVVTLHTHRPAGAVGRPSSPRRPPNRCTGSRSGPTPGGRTVW